MSKRILHLLSLILGFAGLVGCIAAIIGTWSASGRVNRVIETGFRAVDESLVSVQRRITQTQDHVQALRITTEDIERGIKNWTKKEARERVSSGLGVEEKAERLASGLLQADHWLELSESSVQIVQQALEFFASTGAAVESDVPDHLLEELTSLRTQLSDAISSVERIRDRAANVADETSPEQANNQIVQMAVRVIATLTSVDSRLEDIGGRLPEIQTKIRDTESRSQRWIRTVAIAITAVIGWMAAGQASLCYLGWRGLRRRKTLNDATRVSTDVR